MMHGLAAAQTYPTKPVRVILASPAGGTPDVVARILAPGMSAQLGQQLVIDNRGGAGGLISTELTARAVPDGYTLHITGPGALTVLPHLRRDMPYDALRDLAPISQIVIGPYLLIAHPSLSATTVRELIALAKAGPGKLNYASAGNGTSNHLAMELFKSLARIDITHVPYKGAPPAVIDLLAGNIGLMFNSIPPVLQHIKAGRLKLLAVSSAKRSSQLPETPTLNEAGVPGYELVTWFGLLAPARTQQAIIDRLNDTVARVLRAPEIRTQLENMGYEIGGGSPAAFAAYLRVEYDKYAKVVKSSGAKVD
jgi:tripartite-type tricarboxylate transporter receptor subunit TctC